MIKEIKEAFNKTKFEFEIAYNRNRMMNHKDLRSKLVAVILNVIHVFETVVDFVKTKIIIILDRR